MLFGVEDSNGATRPESASVQAPFLCIIKMKCERKYVPRFVLDLKSEAKKVLCIHDLSKQTPVTRWAINVVKFQVEKIQVYIVLMRTQLEDGKRFVIA